MGISLPCQLGTGLLALSSLALLISLGCAPGGLGPAKLVATLTIDGKASFTDVAFSSDGRTLAANDRGDRPAMSVTLWDTAMGSVRSTIDGPDATTPPWFVLAPGGNHVAGVVEGGVRLWDVVAGKSALLRLEVHGTPGLAFSPDGKLLAVGPDRKRFAVTLLDIASGRVVEDLAVQGSGGVLAFSLDGKTLAAQYSIRTPGSEKLQNVVRLWDVPSRRQRGDLDYGDTIVTDVVLSPDGKLLATTEAKVRVWDLASDPPRVRWQQQQPTPLGLAFSPDGHVLLVGDRWGEVKFLEAASGKELHALKVQSRAIMSLALSPDGRLLAVAAGMPSVTVWDVSGILAQKKQ